MAKKKKVKRKPKAKVKAKKAKAKRSALSKGETVYTDDLPEKAALMIKDLQLINGRGELEFGKIAKILNIPLRTFNSWRNQKGDYFKPELVKAMAEAHSKLLVSVDLRKIHAGQILKAQGKARETTIIKEPVAEGPRLPAFSRYTKPVLIDYARRILKLKLTRSMTKCAMEEAIRSKAEKMTTVTIKEVRRVTKTQPPDTPAAKYCDQNMGDEGERWSETENLRHGVDDALGELLKEISGNGSGLQIN